MKILDRQPWVRPEERSTGLPFYVYFNTPSVRARLLNIRFPEDHAEVRVLILRCGTQNMLNACSVNAADIAQIEDWELDTYPGLSFTLELDTPKDSGEVFFLYRELGPDPLDPRNW